MCVLYERAQAKGWMLEGRDQSFHEDRSVAMHFLRTDQRDFCLHWYSIPMREANSLLLIGTLPAVLRTWFGRCSS